jgi:hypothetical protein
VGIRLSDCPDHTNQLVNSIKGSPRKLELVLALLVLFSPSPHVIDRSVAIMRLAIDWSRWTTSPYYAIVILIIACGSIPKGVRVVISPPIRVLTVHVVSIGRLR